MNHFKTAVLLAALTGLLIGIGHLIGGMEGALAFFGIALVMNLVSYWYSDKIVLKMYRAQEVDPERDSHLHAMVERCAQNAGIPKPRVYRIPTDMPNAFATGRNPKNGVVAVTTGLERMLQPDEVEGVIAHEVAHIKNRDTLVSTIAAAIAGAISMLGYLLYFRMFAGGRGGVHPLVLVVVMFIAPLAAAIIQMAVSRTREYMADARGAEYCGKPLALASALRKLEQSVQRRPVEAQGAQSATAHLFIVNPFRAGGMAKLFSTHPPMDDRIRRLEQMARSSPGGPIR